MIYFWNAVFPTFMLSFPLFLVSITLVSNATFVTTSWILVSVEHPAVRMDLTGSCVISEGYTLTKSNFTSQVSISEANINKIYSVSYEINSYLLRLA